MTALAEKRPVCMTTADVHDCIRKHFGRGGDKYAVLFEVRNAAGFNANRSIDAVVMSLWPSLGLELWGMEIKVNRGDWLRELKNPGKASDVWHHFDRWWLVAPDDVAKREEIPEPWGWFIPRNGTLLKSRDAAKNAEVKPLSRGMLAMLMRQTAQKESAPIEKAVATALADQRREHDAQIERRSLERLDGLRHDAEQWAKLRDVLKEKPGDWISQPDVIAAIQMLLKCGVGRSYSGVRSLIDAIDRAQEDLQKIAGELGLKKRGSA